MDEFDNVLRNLSLSPSRLNLYLLFQEALTRGLGATWEEGVGLWVDPNGEPVDAAAKTRDKAGVPQVVRDVDARVCVALVAEGGVTGVGYRYWVRDRADRLGIVGTVRNASSTKVEAVLCGTVDAVAALVATATRGPRWAAPTKVSCDPVANRHFHGFAILR